MKTIQLPSGVSAIVDDEDFDDLNRFKWHAIKDSCNSYAARHDPDNHARLIIMHRLIINAAVGQQVDHINGNGLDNRKENLRVCTAAQNQHNSRLRKDSRSGYKGVRWHKATGRWMVTVTHLGKQHSCGYFTDKVEAAKRYNEVALRLHGEFARVNPL